MEPGPELDAAVAERVMGWTLVPLGYTPGAWTDDVGIVVEKDKWSPSTDWRAAGEVIEVVRAKTGWFEMDSGEHVGWDATFSTSGDPEDRHSGETGPHAISLAALAAKEEKT